MNRKIKYMIFTIIGIIIGSTIGVIGSNVITANQVGINSSKTSKTNIQDAIDELYTKANKKNIIYGKTSTASGKTVVTSSLPTGVKAIVYLDPTDLSKSCNASNSVSTTGTKTGCMKWYAYLEDSDSYTMILDHNAVPNIAWNSNNINILPSTLQSEIDKLVSVSGWKVTPRLITGQEISDITKNTTWQPGSLNYYFYTNCSVSGECLTGQNKYAWLFDYTNGCTLFGCNIVDDSVYGYFTSTAAIGGSDSVWLVYYQGCLAVGRVNETIYGLRPVITILK